MYTSASKASACVILVTLVLTACAGTPQPPNIQATIAAAVAQTQAVSHPSSATPFAVKTSLPPGTAIPTAQPAGSSNALASLVFQMNPALPYLFAIPIESALGNPDSARAGYRAVYTSFGFVNSSSQVIDASPMLAALANGAAIGMPTAKAVDQRGFEYPMPGRLTFSAGSQLPDHLLPPGLAVLVYVCLGELPNDAVGDKIVYGPGPQLGQIVRSLPFPSGVPAGGILPRYNTLPMVGDLAPQLSSVGSSANMPDLADLTFVGTNYSANDRQWTIVLRLKNLYGYDLHGQQIHLAVLEANGLYTGFPSDDNPITPGSEGSLQYIVRDDYASQDAVLVVAVSPNVNDPHQKNGYLGYVEFRMPNPQSVIVSPQPSATPGLPPTEAPAPTQSARFDALWRQRHQL